MKNKGRLRIVIPVIHYFPDRPSGSGRLAFDHACFLANMGHEVWMIGQAVTNGQPECVTQRNLHVLRYAPLGMGALDPRRLKAHQNKSQELLSRHIRGLVDVVHGHSLLGYDGALGFYGRQIRACFSMHSPVGPEIIAGARNSPLIHRLRSRLAARLAHGIESRCLKKTIEITVFSQYTRSLLLKLHGNGIAARARVIPGWIDPERFRIINNRQQTKVELGWPVDRKVFLTVRRLFPRMGLERLIRAVRVIASRGVPIRLVIAGTGPQLDELKTLVHNLELDASVQFAGYVSDEILPRMYAAADAFVLPTAELECFGLIILESLSCGCPVLATPVGAIPEILQAVEPCWLAKDESLEAMVQLLFDFVVGRLPQHDPEHLRGFVAGKYSRDQVINELAGITIGDSV
jgi:glycosyltransferase involved in cell wall biosynthesis